MDKKNPKGQKSLTTSNTSGHPQKHTASSKNPKNSQSKTRARSNNCFNNRSNNYSNGKKSRNMYQMVGKAPRRERVAGPGPKDGREFMSRTLDARGLQVEHFGAKMHEKDRFDKQSVLQHLCINYKINPRKIALNRSPLKKQAFTPTQAPPHPKPLQLPLKQQYQQSISKIFHILDIFSRGTISEANINRWVPEAALYFLGTVFQKIRNNRLVLTEAEFLSECQRVYQRSAEPDIREFVGNIRRFSDINQEKVSMQAGTQPRQLKQTIQSQVEDKFTLNPALLTITPQQHSFRALQPKLNQSTMPLLTSQVHSQAHKNTKINTNTGRQNQCDNGNGYRGKENNKGGFTRNQNRNSLRKQYKKKIILQDNQPQSKNDKQNQNIRNTNNMQNKFSNITLTNNPNTNKVTQFQHQCQQQKSKKQKPRIITPLNDINIFQNVAKSKMNRVVHQVNHYDQEKEREREINLPLKGDNRRDRYRENVGKYKYNMDMCMPEDKNTRRSGNQSPFFQATTLKTIFANQFQHPEMAPSQKSNTTPTSSSIISNPTPPTETQPARTSIPPAPIAHTSPLISITSIVPTISMTINRKMEWERAAVGEGDRIDRLAGKLEDYIRRNAERIQMSKNYRDGFVAAQGPA